MVTEATVQSLAGDGRETPAEAQPAKVPTMDEAPRTASNIAELPTLLSNKFPAA